MRAASLLLWLGSLIGAGVTTWAALNHGWGWWFVVAVLAPLGCLGTWDLLQARHSILRNFPILGHLRFFFESIRPEMMQYFVETDQAGMPYNRVVRTVVYERAKNVEGVKAFGTELNVYDTEYEFLAHSVAPKPEADPDFRVTVGNHLTTKPYNASIFNISAMSFGALSPNALEALNKGAKMGNFFHDTGEGGVSPYHTKHGGDLVQEVGSGYFGCRDSEGRFNPDMFAETATSDQVKMVEIKVSQGAKAGHGGVLPGPKVSAEIAAVRRVPEGKDCISPAYHTAFTTPIELLEFTHQLRTLSGGKPAGFKICIGQPHEFLAICKAMIETELYPDFIVIDGAEGGTGAGPEEFLDHMGVPLTEGLIFAHNALVGAGVRKHLKLAASAKIATAFGIASRMAMGADWCNAARAFMFAVGCIQAERCHTNTCPVGVATQDKRLYRGLVIPDKAQRVYHFHKNTMEALAQVVAAAGLEHPSQLTPEYIARRVSPTDVRAYSKIYEFLTEGELLDNGGGDRWKEHWNMARADRFEPA